MNVSIKNKSHYSCGLAVGTSKQYLEAAKEKNITHFAITDFCTLGGALDFYNQKKKTDIKIAIGVEFKIDYGGALDSFPISLICKNQEGYINLCKLVTLANKNNKILNIHDIYEHYEGLVCISQDIQHKESLSKIFNDNLYFEIIPYEDRRKHNLDIISQVDHTKVVLSSDAHMPNVEDKVLQDIMIQNSTFGSKDNTFPFAKYMMGTKELLTTAISNLPSEFQQYLISGIKNAKNIIEECSQLELNFKDQIVNYPHLLHRLNKDNCDKETLLRRIIKENNRWDQENKEYKERLEYEIDSITNNSRVNLIDYFLVLEDLCEYCSANDIPVGPGRGSGPASLVLYGLKVTHLDPIRHGLLFERFISKGRIEAGTLPDVDLDFANQDVVREYLINLYGEDRVKPIGTYQTLATRGAIKDAFRTLYPDVDFVQSNRITFLVDNDLRQEGDTESDFFQRQLTDNEPFQIAMEDYPRVSEAVSSLVGYNRQPGVHPCGLAITQDPIDEFVPTRFTKDNQVLEYQADYCEQSGIIKYDILGLKTLKFFQKCLKLISEKFKDEDLKGLDYPKTIYDILLDDIMTYEAFERGDTESVFQFNSNVAKAILTKIKVNSLDDLSMVTSVGRPGPMKNGQHFNFMKRKNKEVPSTPPHPALEELLKDTFGIMIYQESVMKCAQLMGGYSLAETDNIRKAMGKKKIEILLPYKEGFIKHCQEKYPDTKQMMPKKKDEQEAVSKAEYIWHLMETFSGYGFNKSHSMCYALIGYYCQYLKVHYPLEWWSACLEHAGGPEHTKAFYAAFKNRILLPSINMSTDKYQIEYEKKYTQDENGDEVEGFIIMPFDSVKNVGEKASHAIQESAPYSSFEDFFKRVNKRACNKRVVCNLIFAGAFDSFETDKEKLLSEYYILRKEKKIPKEHQNITRDFELDMKHQVMDFLTLDYIEMYPHLFGHCLYPSQIKDVAQGDPVVIVGKIIKISKRKKHDGDPYLVIQISNCDENYDVVAWTEEVKFYKDSLQEKEVVRIDGIVNHKFKANQISINKVHLLKECIKFGGINI